MWRGHGIYGHPKGFGKGRSSGHSLTNLSRRNHGALMDLYGLLLLMNEDIAIAILFHPFIIKIALTVVEFCFCFSLIFF